MTARKTARRKRTPFGSLSQKLNLDQDTMDRLEKEGKVPRIINDVDNRIQEALAGDYEFVLAKREPIKTGDKEEEQEKDRKIRFYVGTKADNSPMYAYLMAIPKEYHAEDQQAKEEVNEKVDEAIRAGQPTGLKSHGVGANEGSAYVKGVDYKP